MSKSKLKNIALLGLLGLLGTVVILFGSDFKKAGLNFASIFLADITSGTTYYIDAANGNDNNSGTSESSPWKTIAKVNSMAFSPGDSILFKRGETWREQLIVSSSGAEGKPIIFGAYGSGENPKITGTDIISGWTGPNTNGEYTKTGMGITRNFLEDGIRLNRGSYGSLSSGEWDYNFSTKTLYWKPSDGKITGHKIEAGQRNNSLYAEGKSYINIENLVFYGGNNKNNDDASGGGVELVSCSYFNLENSTFINNFFCGIGISGSSHIDIINCESAYNHASGLRIAKSSSDISVSGGRYHHNSPVYSDALGGGDKNGVEAACAKGECSNINVIGAEVDHNGLGIVGNPSGNDADASIAFYDASGNIKRCHIHHNGGGGSYFHTNSASKITGEFSYNLVYRNNQNNEPNGAGGFRANGAPGKLCTVNIYNNVIAYNTLITDNSGNALRAGYYCENSKIKNNIIAFNSGGTVDIFISNTGESGTELNHNLYFDSSGDFINYKGTTYDVGHVIGNSAGYYSYDKSQDKDSISQNPLFIDEPNNNFHLQPTSPVIDKGTDVGLTEDFEGTAVPQGSAPDIGAYEYVGVADTTPPAPPTGLIVN